MGIFDSAQALGAQFGKIITESERVMSYENPDRLLLLGDTNSALWEIVAKRLRILVYHMEAGNRCYDDPGGNQSPRDRSQ